MPEEFTLLGILISAEESSLKTRQLVFMLQTQVLSRININQVDIFVSSFFSV